MAKKAHSNSTAFQVLKLPKRLKVLKEVATGQIFVPIQFHPVGGYFNGLLAIRCGRPVATISGRPYFTLDEIRDIWRCEQTHPGRETQMKNQYLELFDRLPGMFGAAAA